MCLAVTSHLHFWQNDRDLLRATAVTQVWNGYRNKSQHRKLTLEKRDSNPGHFDHESDALTTELSPLSQAIPCLSLLAGILAVLLPLLDRSKT